MKTLIKIATLFSSVLATLSLAAGFDQFATKLDPVSKRASSLSTFDAGEVAPLPCLSCVIDPE
jgi:hypothetical protein